jgi:hypothetical protein
VKPRILYVERKAGAGEAWIGLVSFSKTGRTLYYRGKSFRSLGGTGIDGNYFEVESGEEYWISGCKRNGADKASVATSGAHRRRYCRGIQGNDSALASRSQGEAGGRVRQHCGLRRWVVWRRRESNPRPEAFHPETLRA